MECGLIYPLLYAYGRKDNKIYSWHFKNNKKSTRITKGFEINTNRLTDKNDIIIESLRFHKINYPFLIVVEVVVVCFDVGVVETVVDFTVVLSFSVVDFVVGDLLVAGLFVVVFLSSIVFLYSSLIYNFTNIYITSGYAPRGLSRTLLWGRKG